MRYYTPRRRMTRQDWALTAGATLCAAAALWMAWHGLTYLGVHL